MNYYLYIILAYLLGLTAYNIRRSRQIRSQEDFMVAGRSLSLTKMVFTLVCTWIGSGTFIAGAEFASYAGWSAVWQPAGAFLGIAIIYFVAAKIRTFGQYTIGDILEVRYGRFARLFGAIALIIAFTTIVSYQFRAGGEILNVVTDGAVSPEVGQTLAAVFVILFVAVGGMVAVAHTDLPNGIIIVTACLLAFPFVVSTAGGWSHAHDVLPAGHFEVFSPDFGKYPALKALSYFLSTLFLLLGVQSMYQKFYAAKSPAEARRATAIWIVGTIIVETIVIGIAVYAYSYNVEHRMNWSGRALVLNAARYMVPAPVGVLLLGAACAVVLSTGMNYLLSSSSNLIRDIYQKTINPASDPGKMVGLQKAFIVVTGVCAFLMIFVPTYLESEISVLRYAYFAYTMYGVSVTPALFAALTWKRATRQGGVASIVGGALATIFFEVLLPYLAPSIVVGTDAWGIPSFYPAALISIGLLVAVSLLTPPPEPKALEKLFPAAAAGAR
ncbi:MAG TPA: sodium:solute symporter family protein [Vicinamibacterales bacterium]|nr:sodium:solute symporter family protein [Vicinamibacterales bacterium]HPW21501.1 sodium:solute symporter family protein [Vicinamibacterales bacterium]